AIVALSFSFLTSQALAASTSLDILREGLLGAGTGAIAASASGGNAGKGALIGAGTNVIGGALLDMLTGPSTSPPAPVYYSPQPAYAPTTAYSANVSRVPQKHIIRKFDTNGNIVSEEEILQ
ncbi:MAG: hypothetical protein COT00_01840, partial [Candidatus Omnitrophica bacterium CG07_land_8_20_14_0_80_50_8]